MSDRKYLPAVREQYEAYPFPPRDPQEERSRLIDGYVDQAGLVNHYCFAGRQSFEKVRILIAGGGTGDATIFWAEQLRDKNSEVVHVDISEAAIAVARERAAVRGLDNITWKHMSLLDVDSQLGVFHFVNCHGVLHHLEDPAAGLQVLHAALAEKGAGVLLLYAAYGRLALYQIQELVSRIGVHDLPIDQRIAVARQFMEALPESSWYKRSSYRDAHKTLPDSVFFDSYLHTQDQAYTVPELYEFIENGKFRFVEFCNGTQRVRYRPETYIRDKTLLARFPDDLRERQATAELLAGNIDRHECFISKEADTIARLDDLENVPFFSPTPLAGVAKACAEATDGRSIDIDRGSGVHVRFRPRRYTQQIFEHLDGTQSLGEIFDRVRKEGVEASDDELLEDFRPTYDVFNRVDLLLLRHRSVPAFLTGAELQARTFASRD